MNHTNTYFDGCRSEADIKARYRDLAKQHHPDLGGDAEIMKAVNAAYESALRGEYRKTMSDQQADEAVEMDAEIARKVAEIIHLKGLILELVGRWLWVTGETYAAKAELKAAGFFWASKKAAWYFRKDVDSAGRSSGLDLEGIKAKYGSRTLNGANSSRRCIA